MAGQRARMRRGEQRFCGGLPMPGTAAWARQRPRGTRAVTTRGGEGTAVGRMRCLPGQHCRRSGRRRRRERGGQQPLPLAAGPRGAPPRQLGSAGTAPPLRQDGAAGTETPLEVERRLLDGFRASAAAALPREVRVLERRVIDARDCGRPGAAVEPVRAASSPLTAGSGRAGTSRRLCRHPALCVRGPALGLDRCASLTGEAGWPHGPGPPCLQLLLYAASGLRAR